MPPVAWTLAEYRWEASENSRTHKFLRAPRAGDSEGVLLMDFVKPRLESGCAVMLSVWPSCKGHLVRVQNITDEGIIVDDPFW